MPDIMWWRPAYSCLIFGPSVINGRVDESLPIMCHDANETVRAWGNEWRWSIDGERLGTYVEDLMATQGKVEGKYFVFAKNS